MRRIVAAIGLEAFAVLLALTQMLGGVQSDEAKYLLNIPYPHPPLLRWLMGQTERMPHQEFFWRVILATLLIQSVWIVASLGRRFSRDQQRALCGLWLLSSAIILQAGSVMMAPVTAVVGLVLIAISNIEYRISKQYAGWIALLWLTSLFIAYQSILFLPIVLAIYRRMEMSIVNKIAAVFIPVVLVVLYVATNPLAVGSFLNASGEQAAPDLLASGRVIATSMILGGSVVLSILGIVGMILGRRWMIFVSFLLVIAYLFVTFRSYNVILFIPLFVGGVASAPVLLKRSAIVLAAQVIALMGILSLHPLVLPQPEARNIMSFVNDHATEGPVLITHSFGHQWQYESLFPILHYREQLVSRAGAIVCLGVCSALEEHEWTRYQKNGFEILVRNP